MMGNQGRGLRVLVVGPANDIFSDFSASRSDSLRVVDNMVDAIDTARQEQFDVIGVVIAGSKSVLRSGLEALRDVCRSTKIVLFVPMWREPEAVELCKSEGAADDYVLYPIELGEFKKLADQVGQRGVRQRQDLKGERSQKIREYGQESVAQRMEDLEKLATTDELTGLKNRRYTWEFARQIIERSREEGKQVTLLMFDIDDFKHYNDEYSHTAGDEILKQAAILVKRCCREHDVVGRIGGDEFAVIFWEDPHKQARDKNSERRAISAEHPRAAIDIAKRFRGELNKAEFNLLGPEGRGVLTISGGLATFPRDGQTIEELVQKADDALLEAKRSGKNMIYLVGSPQGDIDKIG